MCKLDIPPLETLDGKERRNPYYRDIWKSKITQHRRELYGSNDYKLNMKTRNTEENQNTSIEAHPGGRRMGYRTHRPKFSVMYEDYRDKGNTLHSSA